MIPNRHLLSLTSLLFFNILICVLQHPPVYTEPFLFSIRRAND